MGARLVADLGLRVPVRRSRTRATGGRAVVVRWLANVAIEQLVVLAVVVVVVVAIVQPDTVPVVVVIQRKWWRRG
jgi:hypothetical protein